MNAEELIRCTANGDQQAFRLLYEMYSAKVYNTCLMHLQDTHEAEEATQDVFVEIYHAAARFEGKSSATTWIYRISVNKSLDRIRYKKRRKRFAFISSLFHQDTGEPLHEQVSFEHPGILAERKEDAAQLLAALKQLPENQQTAFILRKVEGLPQKEIAAIMQLNEKAVESLVQRAKANLRKILTNGTNEGKNSK